jgi:hypothetical protein
MSPVGLIYNQCVFYPISSYIRVKRRNQTFFIHTSPSDTFAHIKSEIALALGGNDIITPQHMRLYIATPTNIAKDRYDDQVASGKSTPQGPIPDTATLSEYDVKNDAVLYVTFIKAWESCIDSQVSDEDDVWEEIEATKS